VGLVLLAAAFGQWLVFQGGVIPIVSSDGTEYYLFAAHALPGLQGLVDPKVPPGYPLFLGAIFLAAGHDNLVAMLVIQATLFVAALVETYALLATIGIPRPVSAAVAGLLGAAPWLVQWERYVLAESLSFCAIATLLLVFVHFLRHPAIRWAIACGLIGATIPMTRAALVLVPGTLLLVLLLRAVLAHRLGLSRRTLAVSAIVFGVVSYAPVAGYTVANAVVNNCYCFTSIGNLNLLGKVYEYNLQLLPADPKYASLAVEVRAAGDVDTFVQDHPEYAAENFATPAAYARSQFLRYPRTTFRYLVRDMRALLVLNIDHSVLQPHPSDCSKDPSLPYPLVTGDAIHPSDGPYCTTATVSVSRLGEDVNRVIYGLVFMAYVLLPLSLALGAAVVFVQPKRELSWMLLATAGVVALVLVTAALTGFVAFDRLRVPVDGVALVSVVLMLYTLWSLARAMPGAIRILLGSGPGSQPPQYDKPA
jgi:hypothetical protein